MATFRVYMVDGIRIELSQGKTIVTCDDYIRIINDDETVAVMPREHVVLVEKTGDENEGA